MIDLATTRLLVADMVRRQYGWPALTVILMSAAMWWISDADSVRVAFAVSLGVTFAIGPIATITNVTRAVSFLPLSRREVWLANWFVGAIVATALTTMAKLPALLFGLDVRDGGLGIIALSSLHDFAAAGTGCLVLAITQRPLDRSRLWIERGLRGLAVVTIVGCPIWIFALYRQLPTQWGHVTWMHGVTLTLTLAMALATAAYAPAVAHAGARPAPQVRTTGAPRRALYPFTGAPGLVVHELAWAICVGLFLAVTFGAIAFVVDGAMGNRDTAIAFLRRQRVLILDGAASHLGDADPRMFQMLVWYGFFAASICGRFGEQMRHLRALPLSTSTIVALVVAWPAGVWLAVWAALIVLSSTIGDGVRSLHPWLWFEMVALSALSQALTLSLARRHKWIFFSVPVWFVPIINLVSAAPVSVGVGVACAALVGAVLLTRTALAQSSTYAATPSPYPQPQLN